MNILEQLSAQGYDVCICNHGLDGPWQGSYSRDGHEWLRVYAPTLRSCLNLLKEEAGISINLTGTLEGDLVN